MRHTLARHWPFCLLLVGLSALMFWDVGQVPFHPDESTYLFMSHDLDVLLSHPLEMAWEPGQEELPVQRYRELDAPLGRYLAGVGRSLAGLPALAVDWNWEKSWSENQQAGAVPAADLLLAGRLAITLLLPFSLLLAYRIGIDLEGRKTGLLGAALLGLNALVLLHGRRVMAEGVLIFGVLLAVWSFLRAGRYPWLAGLGIAVAYNAKTSGLALLPIGLIAVVWTAAGEPDWLRKGALKLTQFFLAFLLVTLALNPIFWRHPVSAYRAAWEARQALLRRQMDTIQANMPNQILGSPGLRVVAMTANLFLLPPAFEDVGNYVVETASSETRYMSFPVHHLLRGLIPGGILLAMTLLGIIFGCVDFLRSNATRRRNVGLVLLATLTLGAALFIAVPLSWQRYIVPLIPLTSLWAAYGLRLPQNVSLKNSSPAAVET